MGTCSDEELAKMSQTDFWGHLEGIATKIKDKVASRVAEDLLDVAEKVQEQEDGGAAESRDAGDIGYDEALKKYNIDLKEFDATDADAAEHQLKTDDLMWIVTQFERAGQFPTPKIVETQVDAFNLVGGNEKVYDVEFSKNDKPKSSDSNLEQLSKNISAGDGYLGDTIFNKVTFIDTAVAGWHSGAASSFKERFLPEIAAAVVNQTVAAKTLRSFMAANQGMLLAGRRNFDDIAHNGYDAVMAFEGCISDGSGDADIQATLGVTAGVLTIVGGVLATAAGAVAAPETAGSSLAISAGGISAVAGGVSTIQNAMGIETQKQPLGAGTIEDVVYNIKQAVENAYTDFDGGQEELRNALDTTRGELEELTKYYKVPRPSTLASANRDNIVSVVEG